MKTAVEWLVEHLTEYGFDLSHHELEIQQAKEMEKTQQAKEYLKGFKDGKEYEIKIKQLTFKSE
jgi:hypothetical protein